MTIDEYIAQRVDDQIGWYDRKSQQAQQSYKRLRRAEIVCAAAIPFLAGVAERHALVPIAMGLLGAMVVVLAAMQSLGQHHENWIEYRTTCEALKHEKYLLLTKTRPYDSEEPLPRFVERVESLLSKEHRAWSQNVRVGLEASKPSSRRS